MSYTYSMRNKQTKIIFLCHGNICRSTMAEGIAKELFERENLQDQVAEEYGEVVFSSRAVSREALGDPPYPLTIKELEKQGFKPQKYLADKVASFLRPEDQADNCYLFYMDERNRLNLERYHNLKPTVHCEQLLEHEIDDPWYTRDFTTCFTDIERGVRHIFDRLKNGTL